MLACSEAVKLLSCGPPSALDGVQAKLMAGSVNDPREVEADAMADAVMSGKRAGTSKTTHNGAIHRSCSSCQDEEIHRETAVSSARVGPGAEALVGRACSRNGISMGTALRSRMESGFGRDLGGVRIHAGSDAAQAARSIEAKAFTAGHDVFFGAGQFAPQTTAGQRLIAHELTHVVQGDKVLRREPSDKPSTDDERPSSPDSPTATTLHRRRHRPGQPTPDFANVERFGFDTPGIDLKGEFSQIGLSSEKWRVGVHANGFGLLQPSGLRRRFRRKSSDPACGCSYADSRHQRSG